MEVKKISRFVIYYQFIEKNSVWDENFEITEYKCSFILFLFSKYFCL